jgi:hypothetical protein
MHLKTNFLRLIVIALNMITSTMNSSDFPLSLSLFIFSRTYFSLEEVKACNDSWSMSFQAFKAAGHLNLGLSWFP